MHDIDPPQLRWQEAASAPPLEARGLHLWRIPLDSGDAHSDTAALRMLSERQRERFHRLRGERLQLRYLRAQAGCRAVLAAYTGAPPAEIAFRYGPAGKPELADHTSQLHFNLTTTGDLALLGVSDGLPVGIDCEQERARPDLDGVARRMLDAQAVRAVVAAPPEAAARLFYLHWTALEARVKADGRGLSRRRQADMPGLSVAHALAGLTNGTPALCAVARQHLPPAEQWGAFRLTGR